jgi:urease gamma subunit
MNQGHFARALPVFEALLSHFPETKDQLLVRAHIVRAAGGSGAREVFRKTWNEGMRLAREPEAVSVLADSLLEMARGAASLGEWDRAEQSAERALAVAMERNEPKLVLRAEGVLDSIRTGRSVEKAVAAQAAGRQAEQADALAQEMVRSLESRAAVAA